MKEIIRHAEIYVQTSVTINGVKEAAEIELHRILDPYIGKRITPELINELKKLINRYLVGVSIYTDVELPPVITQIQIKQ